MKLQKQNMTPFHLAVGLQAREVYMEAATRRVPLIFDTFIVGNADRELLRSERNATTSSTQFYLWPDGESESLPALTNVAMLRCK